MNGGPRLIIGFAGEIVSGKTTCAKYLIEKHAASGFRFSTPMRDVARRLHLPESREVLQTISLAMRSTFGENFWSGVAAQDIGQIKSSLVVIDGVRRLADIETFKNDSRFVLVYIKADVDIRYQRIVKRGENVDDVGKTIEEFKREQEYEAEQQIRSLEPLAEVVIDNGGSLEELHAKLDGLLSLKS